MAAEENEESGADAEFRLPVEYKIRAAKSAKRELAAPFSDFQSLLFWQWIRRKVCVDQHPFVALFHKNAR
jgi:hypothetical protein